MEDARKLSSLSFAFDDIRHVVAGQEFKAYTRPYTSTLFATLHLLADDEEITYTNKLPSEFDLIDTVRAQQQLVETLEATGTYEGVPFCCVCSDRACSAVHWTVTERDTGRVLIRMRDLTDQHIGQTPYEISKPQLYAGFDEFWTEVLKFCSGRDILRFEWADRKDPPVSGRDAYATTTDIQAWRAELSELIDG